MPIASPEDYLHATRALEARDKRERAEEELKQKYGPAHASLRAYLEAMRGLAPETYFWERVTKGVKLGPDGLEIKEAGSVIIRASWKQDGEVLTEKLVINKNYQPLSQTAREFYGAHAERGRWLGGAVEYDDSLFLEAQQGALGHERSAANSSPFENSNVTTEPTTISPSQEAPDYSRELVRTGAEA